MVPPALDNAIAAARRRPAVRRGGAAAQRGFRAIAPALPDRLVRHGVLLKARLLGNASGGSVAQPSDFGVVFDARFYADQAGRVPPGFAPVDHFRRLGWPRGLDPSPLFDTDWYLARHPEVAESGTDPLSHYLERGWTQRWDPAPWFSTGWYLDRLADDGVPAQNPLVHYVTIGCTEGRTVSAEHGALVSGDPRTAQPRRQGAEVGALLLPGNVSEQVPITTVADAPQWLVTFDMWDTLIGRDRPADAAKVATARRMARLLGRQSDTWELFDSRVAEEAARAVSDEHEEYELTEVLESIAVAAGMADTDARRCAVELAELEIRDECDNTHRLEPMASVFAEVAGRSDRRTFVLSDFYIGAEGLSRILAANDLDVASDDVLVSCEIEASKRLGSAYAVAQARAGVEPPDHLHVGDNLYADVQPAVERGVAAFHVDKPRSRWPAPGALDREWYDRVPFVIRDEMAALLIPSTHAHREPILIRRARSAASTVAVVAVAHVAAAIEAAVERDLDVVHYMSREGAFLAEVHRRVAPIVAERGAPRAIHLEVSRRSTFGASLADLSEQSLARIARQYPEQSIRGLLVSLGVDPRAVARELAALPLSPDRPVQVAESTVVRELLERPEVRRVFDDTRTQQRRLLDRYLEAREFGERAVVVDVGWRGTIQDNLCLVRQDAEVHGVYVGLFPYHNPQPPNGSKFAVAFDGNLGEPYAFVDPPAIIEGPLTPSEPTCTGYAEHDGRVEPVRAHEHGRAEHLVAALQESTLQIAPNVAHRIVALGASTELIRGGLRRLLESVCSDPPGGLADLWFESAHDDTFGAANVTPYVKRRPGRDLLNSPGELSASPGAIASRWPAGYARWAPVDAIRHLRELRAEHG